MNSSYNTFALFYDRLTENADYEARGDYISGFFSDRSGNGKRLLDLACGTGTLSKYFFDRGYSVTGVDLSADMLTVARQKCPYIDFIQSDMTDFSAESSFDFCICSLDAINHLDGLDCVKKVFKNIAFSLSDGGLFVFDVNTVFKHREILADNTFVFDEDDFFLSWDNNFIGDNDNTVEIFLDFFVFNGKSYDRFSESFKEKAYDFNVLKQSLKMCNFEVLGIFDELTRNSPSHDSERLYFVCRKKGS